MLIKILAGVFGKKDGERVRPVRPGDDPIEVSEEIGRRLIRAGVAAEVEAPEAAKAAPSATVEDDEDAFPDYSAKMSRAKLEAIAKEVGIEADEIEGAETKEQLIELLDEVKAEYEADAAPTFDPEGEMQ